MAQDYWYGGWADMSTLPGTQAVKVAKASGGSYGPLNALADILGAYWQKRARDDSVKAIEEYEASLDPAAMNPPDTPQFAAPNLLDALPGGKQNKMQLMQPGQFGTDEWAQANMQPQQKPLSLNEYSQKARGMKSKLMRDLYMKYPQANIKELAQWVDEITNNRIMSYGDKERGSIYDSISQNGGLTQAMMPELMRRADEYNTIMQGVGGTPISLKDLVGAFASKIGNVDAGGRIIQQATPANGLPYRYEPVMDDNGKVVGRRPVYVQTVGGVNKSLSPGQKQQGEIARQKMAQAQYNADRNYALARAKFELQKNNPSGGGSRGGSRGADGSDQEMNQNIRGILNEFRHKKQLAYQAIGKPGSPGAMFTDEDNHAVAEYRDFLHKTLESKYLDDDDIAAIQQELNQLESYMEEVAKS